MYYLQCVSVHDCVLADNVLLFYFVFHLHCHSNLHQIQIRGCSFVLQLFAVVHVDSFRNTTRRVLFGDSVAIHHLVNQHDIVLVLHLVK